MTATVSAPPTTPSALATRRGRLTLALLCAIAFLDFVDASITNVALPLIRDDLHVSVQGLQWIPSGYLLTYGGFMLLGGRLADLLGRRRIVVIGTALIGISSFAGGLAQNEGTLVAARLAQGLGAALMLPAALSILTTTFTEPTDRHKALGVWGGVGGLASAAGVLLGGLLTDGPGWRWVFFVNPPAAALVLIAIFPLIHADRPQRQARAFDLVGSVLATAGMLLLVFTLVKAPDEGWGSTVTVLRLLGAGALLAAFVAKEATGKNPLLPLDIFRVRGLAAADVTQLIAFAGFLAIFFFLTLYMQNVLGYSPIKTGAAYLPLCFAIGVSAGITGKLISRIGTRPLIVSGALITSAGVYELSHIPVHGSYASDLLPGLLIVAMGIGAVFVATVTAANDGVPPDKAGLAAALLNASQQLGGALGLAIFSAIATARTNHLLASHADVPQALTSGFHRALLAGSVFLLAAALVAVRSPNTRGESTHPASHDEAATPEGANR
jgi:EmrB/QacA subfamily drug resistance transporter